MSIKSPGKVVIGIDLGGTRIKTGLIDDQGEVRHREEYLTRVELGQERVIKRIIKIINELIKKYNENSYHPRIIGLGAPGNVNRAKGLVCFSPNFPDWRDVPLAQLITEGTGLSTFLINDADAVTYGEKWAGAGRDLDNFACLTLGTGVGSGLILNGRLWAGSRGSSPEIGHMTILPRGERCGCGNRGCLETLASATYLVKKARKALVQKVPTRLSEAVSKDSHSLSAKTIYETARQGDPFCLSLFAGMGHYLGIALASLVHTLGLEGVVLGGGLSKASTIFLPYLEKEFKKRLTMFPVEGVSIRISTLGEKSGILGAAGMALARSNGNRV